VTNTNPDKLLVFTHDVSKKELKWEFIHLDNLIKANKKNSAE
jgi:hypothetical protein